MVNQTRKCVLRLAPIHRAAVAALANAAAVVLQYGPIYSVHSVFVQRALHSIIFTFFITIRFYYAIDYFRFCDYAIHTSVFVVTMFK